jgi:ribosomal protein L40E
LEFYPGRIMGIVLGLLILAVIFVLPFGTTDSRTFYSVEGPQIFSLPTVQGGMYAYVLLAAFLLVAIAGVLGVIPRLSGVLGVVGMALITAAPFLLSNGQVRLDPGYGFIAVWSAAAISLGGSFWKSKLDAGELPSSVKMEEAQQQPMVAPIQPREAPVEEVAEEEAEPESEASGDDVVCPDCGASNSSDARKCSACGADLG